MKNVKHKVTKMLYKWLYKALRKTEELRIVIFERKVLREVYGPISDNQTNERRKLHDYDFLTQFQRPNQTEESCRG